MDRLTELKTKYGSVLNAIQQQQAQLTHLHVQDNKLFIGAIASSEEAKNRIWNTIKSVDASYSDLIADIQIDASRAPAQPAAPAAQMYVVQPGDSLSKISKQFYGDAGKYMKIFEANRDQLDDPNKIQAGRKLKIPA